MAFHDNHYMSKLTTKRLAIFITVILALFIVYKVAWPTICEDIATRQLQQISAQEMQPLLPSVNNLVRQTNPKNALECDELSHSYTHTQLFCQRANIYAYNPQPLPAASRAKVVSEAAALDTLLQQHGWTADRQQDTIKTVAGSIPSAPLEAFHVQGVPFHKNIGTISCNLEISFAGPTDGTSPGVINVNRFSCQQHVSFFMLHISKHVNGGFGG